MKILFCSFAYHPSVGGTETVSALLAEQFRHRGHAVELVTCTAGDGVDPTGLPVERRPRAARLFSLVRWADVVFHNNISLRLGWPLALLPRPWVVAHHTWIPRHGIAARLKRLVLRRARHIAPSRALAADLGVPCTVIPNPYATGTFGPRPGRVRDRELLFVGRLVREKGVDLLVDALARLRQRGRALRLTIVGEGPEAPRLRALAAGHGVSDRIVFAGRLTGEPLVEVLNGHQVLVVPSTCEETFGLVALEGMACGCVPIVARSGGLPETVGEAGVVFERGDPTALAAAIEALFAAPDMLERLRAQATRQLARHAPERVAGDYLQVIGAAGARQATHGPARAV